MGGFFSKFFGKSFLIKSELTLCPFEIVDDELDWQQNSIYHIFGTGS